MIERLQQVKIIIKKSITMFDSQQDSIKPESIFGITLFMKRGKMMM